MEKADQMLTLNDHIHAGPVAIVSCVVSGPVSCWSQQHHAVWSTVYCRTNPSHGAVQVTQKNVILLVDHDTK